MVKQLINRGSQLDNQNRDRETALIRAATLGHDKIVEFLLNNKAVVKLNARDGDTALVRAARNGHFEIVDKLLDARAKVHDSQGENAKKHAEKQGHHKVAQRLKTHLGKPNNLGVRLVSG